MTTEDEETTNVFRYLLDHLTPQRASICDAMVFALNHAKAADSLSTLIAQHPIPTPEGLKARLYLASDVLYNSNAVNVQNAWAYRLALAAVLPLLFEQARVADTAEMEMLCGTLVELWREWGSVDARTLKGLESTWKTVPIAKERALTAYLTQYKRALSALAIEDLTHFSRKSGISSIGPQSNMITKLAKLRSLDIDMRKGLPSLPLIKIDLNDPSGVAVERVLAGFEGDGRVEETEGQALTAEEVEFLGKLEKTGALQAFTNSYIIKG